MTSSGLARSAGTEMAFPEKPSLLRAVQASSQALAFREVMKILLQPAWRRLFDQLAWARYLLCRSVWCEP